jgi:hypothetical protein
MIERVHIGSEKDLERAASEALTTLSRSQAKATSACASVATKHNNPQVKPVVFESRSLVLRIVQVSWLHLR